MKHNSSIQFLIDSDKELLKFLYHCNKKFAYQQKLDDEQEAKLKFLANWRNSDNGDTILQQILRKHLLSADVGYALYTNTEDSSPDSFYYYDVVHYAKLLEFYNKGFMNLVNSKKERLLDTFVNLEASDKRYGDGEAYQLVFKNLVNAGCYCSISDKSDSIKDCWFHYLLGFIRFFPYTGPLDISIPADRRSVGARTRLTTMRLLLNMVFQDGNLEVYREM